MDRKEFLKKTGIGALAAVVIPKQLAESLVKPQKVNKNYKPSLTTSPTATVTRGIPGLKELDGYRYVRRDYMPNLKAIRYSVSNDKVTWRFYDIPDYV